MSKSPFSKQLSSILSNVSPRGKSKLFRFYVTNLAGGEARPGAHASLGYTIIPDNGTESVQWGLSVGDSTFGTGAAPTDYSAHDGEILYLTVTDQGETYSRGVPIRIEAGSPSEIPDGQNWLIDDSVVSLDASGTGVGITWTYSAENLPTGLSINENTGLIVGTPVGDENSGTATVSMTDQYGRISTDTFTWNVEYRPKATAANGVGPIDYVLGDTLVNTNFVSDFTANGNTLTYSFTQIPTGVVDDGDGTLSGTPTSLGSGTIICTATDEYGRKTISAALYDVGLRTQATANNTLGPFDFVVDSAIVPQDLSTDFIANGNTLTYTVSPALPTGLSLATNGILSGTPSDENIATSYTITAIDEYGRTTDSTFSIQTNYRTQATANNTLGPFDFVVDSAISPQDLYTDFSDNGNTLTYSVSPALPNGMSLSINGILSGTPNTETTSAVYTITGQDEYGRTTDSTFSIQTNYRTQAIANNNLGPFSWTVDDTSVSVDATTDFTTNGNTLTYTATGLPVGVSIASNGIISGTPTAASNGTIVITGQDEYGRETTSTTSHNTAIRTQATSGAALDMAFAAGTGGTQDLLANVTDNGNTLTYQSVSPALPSGVTVNSVGLLTAISSVVWTADASYNFTFEDEYSRTLTITGTLEITGTAPVTGTMLAVENGPDTMIASGTVTIPNVTGSMLAVEDGPDTMIASGNVTAPTVTGSMLAIEGGPDTMIASGTVTAPGAFNPVSTGIAALGLNGIVDYQPDYPFINVFKNARRTTPDATAGYNALGYPTTATAEYVTLNELGSGGTDLEGTYRITWDGPTGLSTNLSETTIGPNEIEVTVTNVVTGLVAIQVPAGASNVAMVKTDLTALYDAGAVIRPEYLTWLSDLKMLRFMDWTATNGSNQVDWADRYVPDQATYSAEETVDNFFTGVPLEVCIDLANELGTDAWFCIPHQATDDYVTQMATLIRDRLNPALHIYIEYSNETWNGIFPQEWYAREQAHAILGTSSGDEYMQWAGYRAAECMDIFATIFAGQTNRITRTAGGFFGHLGLMDAYLDAPDIIAAVGGDAPVNSFDAIGVTSYILTEYYGPEDNTNHDTLIATFDAEGAEAAYREIYDAYVAEVDGDYTTTLASWNSAMTTRGLDLMMYEGTGHMVPPSGHPRLTDLVTLFSGFVESTYYGDALRRQINAWENGTGPNDGPFNFYGSMTEHSRYGFWGLSQGLADPATPAYEQYMRYSRGEAMIDYGHGATPVTGTMLAIEGGPDTMIASGNVTAPTVTGSMLAVESGPDTMIASGTVTAPTFTGSMLAVEGGPDTMIASGTVTAPGSDDLILYAYHNSLMNHDAGVGGSDTDARNWLERMGTPGVFFDGGEFGFIGQWQTPPANGISAEDTTQLSMTGWSGAASVNHLIFVHDNFEAANRAPNENGGIPGASESYVSLNSALIDAWQTNAANANRTHWIYTGLYDFGLPTGGAEPGSATAQNIADWIAAATDTTTTPYYGYAGWGSEYVADMQAAYPALDIRHMDVNGAFIDAYENTALGNVPFSELFEDNAPHGFSDTYLIIAAIMYSYIFDAQAPAFTPAGGTGINSEITNNWASITARIYDYVRGALPISGTMLAVESGPDTMIASGNVTAPTVTGSMLAVESGPDTMIASGTFAEPGVTGSMLAVEGGPDTMIASGTVTIPNVTGSMLAVESGPDTMIASGTVTGPGVTGSMLAVESGPDTMIASGTVAAPVSADTVRLNGTDNYLSGFGITGNTFRIILSGSMYDLTGNQFMFGELLGGSGAWLDQTGGRLARYGEGTAPLPLFNGFASSSMSPAAITTGTPITADFTSNAGAWTITVSDGTNSATLSGTFDGPDQHHD